MRVNSQRRSIPALLAVVLLLAATAASAGTLAPPDLTLDLAYQYVLPGNTASFTGTITNNDPVSSMFLNSDSLSDSITVNVNDPDLTLDDSPFAFNSNFYAINPGASVSGLLFTAAVPDGATSGTIYLGSFDILGGLDGNASDELAHADFAVEVVSSTPEPSGAALWSSV